MQKKKVTLSLDKKVYESFQKYCSENAIMVSKKIELFMRDFLKKKKIKGFFMIFLVFLFMNLILINAEQLFFDNFESGNMNNWVVWNYPAANPWVAVPTDPYQGSWHAQTNPTNTHDPATNMTTSVSTSGYGNINVSFYRKLIGLDATDWFRVKWFDGTNWNTIEETNSQTDSDYVLRSYSLPSSANNNPNFQLKFECTAGAVSEYCRIDNVKIEGQILDNTPPEFSNFSESPINNSDYSPGQFYQFNITINDSSSLDIVGIEFNGINYTGNYILHVGSVYIFNRTDLSAGNYSYYWWANDTFGNFGKSNTRVYYVSKKSSSVNLTFSHSSPQTYGTAINVSCSSDNPETSAKLYRDGNDVTFSENNKYVVLSGGIHEYICNVSKTQNYTSASIYENFTINKAKGNVSLFLNAIQGNLTIKYPELINASASTPYGNVTLYRDSSDTTSENNINISIGAGFYNYTAISSGNENYSSVSVSYFLNVTKGDDVVNLFLNGIQGNLTLTYGEQLNASASSESGNVNLYRNNSLVNNENNNNVVLAAGTYVYYANSSGNQNYTANSTGIKFYVFINKKNPSVGMSISITPSNNVTYGTQTSASASETNLNDGDLTYFFYRNGQAVANPNIETLDAGVYTYVYNTSGGQNYTSGSVSEILTINKHGNKINLFLNGIQGNLTLTYGEQLNASASSESGNVNLYRNNSLVNNENNNNVVLAAGTYVYYANSSGNQNYLENSSKNFFVDISKANSTIYLYLNSSRNNLSVYENENFSINITLISGEGQVYLYKNKSLIYQGSAPYYNVTSFSKGYYNLTAVYFETQNYTYSSETFFVNASEAPDTQGPFIEIFSPQQNKIYPQNENLALNFSVNDSSNVSSCWYSIDNLNNITIPNCKNTTFNVSFGTGRHVLKFYSNDTLGNINFSERNFTIDLVGINLSIINPVGTKNSLTNIPIEYTASGDNLTCWYEVKNSIGDVIIENKTLENCTDSLFNLSSWGNYVFVLYANNSLGSFKSLNSDFSLVVNSGGSGGSSGGGGSGGGGGSAIKDVIGIPIAEELFKIDFENIPSLIFNSETSKKSKIKVKNSGTKFLNNCKLEGTGKLGLWIKGTEIKNLIPGEISDFEFELNLPENIKSGIYNISFLIKCNEINKTGNLSLQYVEKKFDFLFLNVSRISPYEINIAYIIKELSGIPQNVEVQFIAFGPGQEKIAELNRILYIEGNSSVRSSVLIPVNESFEGELKILVNLNSETYSSFVQESFLVSRFNSVSGFSVLGGVGNASNFLAGFLILIFLIFILYVVKRIRKLRKRITSKRVKHSLKKLKKHGKRR